MGLAATVGMRYAGLAAAAAGMAALGSIVASCWPPWIGCEWVCMVLTHGAVAPPGPAPTDNCTADESGALTWLGSVAPSPSPPPALSWGVALGSASPGDCSAVRRWRRAIPSGDSGSLLLRFSARGGSSSIDIFSGVVAGRAASIGDASVMGGVQTLKEKDTVRPTTVQLRVIISHDAGNRSSCCSPRSRHKGALKPLPQVRVARMAAASGSTAQGWTVASAATGDHEDAHAPLMGRPRVWIAMVRWTLCAECTWRNQPPDGGLRKTGGRAAAAAGVRARALWHVLRAQWCQALAGCRGQMGRWWRRRVPA